MKRALKALIIGLCVLAFAFSGAVTALAQGSAGDAVPASETDGTSARTESLELFLPSSPEQFLPLNSPTDYAINENYIAVSEGNTIYLYDKTSKDGYKTFTDEYEVASLNLYEYDGGTYLYYVSRQSGSLNQIRYIRCDTEDFATQEPTDTGSGTCYRFVIGNGYVCFVDASKYVYLTTIDGLTIAQENRQIFFDGSDIYFAVSESGTIYFSAGRTIKQVQSDSFNSADWLTTEETVGSFSVQDNAQKICYYSTSGTENNTLRFCNGSEDQAIKGSDGNAIENVSALHCYNETLYLISNAAICAFTADGFTDYQITQYGDQTNRLGENASSLSLYGDTLLIADTQNGRILQYRGGAYSVAASVSSPEIICAGQDSFAVFGNSSSFSIYEADETGSYSLVYLFPTSLQNIIGIAYSFGSYYALTSNGTTYVFTPDAVAGYSLQTGSISVSGTSMRSLAAGIDGNLYVLSGDNNVYRYNAAEFLTTTSAHTSVATFNDSVTDILIDYAGNVYGLTADSVLCKSTDSAENPISETPLGLSSFVSYADDAQAVAFAFGFETGDAYILTDSGFIVKWSYGIESLDNIEADGAYNALTGAAASDAYSGILVTVSQDAVAVLLDESAFSADMQTLPTDGYARAGSLSNSANSGKPITGVKAYEIEGVGTVVALYEYVPGQTEAGSDYVPTQRNYTLCLVLEGGLQSVEQDSYYTAETSVGYTTNAVGLYNLPLMRTGSAAYRLELPKGTQVTVLGRISCAASAEGGWGLDADYCFVSCTVDGQTVYGFLPAPYVSAAPPAGTAGSGTEDITFRYLKQQQITLSDGETLTILGAADEEGNIYATYEYRGVTYGGKVALSLLGEESVSGENTTRPLLEGSSVTLYNTERLTVYGGPDENGLVRVSYTLNGRNYTALISEDLLADASDFGTWVLVAVTIVTAAVLASACHLVLRKPPMITPPLSAEEAESGADGDGADGEADGADRPAEERERPSDDGEEE